MTNLNKFAAQQLTKKQMNNIKGGSASCAPGLHAYNCVLAIDGIGHGEVGHVCAEDVNKAKEMADDALRSAGLVVSEDFGNVCSSYR